MNGLSQNVDILIVDDLPDNLRLLSRMLVRRGYEIWTAKSGYEALDFLATSTPELILLDVNMPGIDGYEVCRRIKDTPALHEIPIIFLSALSEPSDKLRGFDAGGVDYVTKPFHFHEVIARVETHLELYRQKRENERLRKQERASFERVTLLKDQVLNTATHDLKNPLTSIKLSVSLLRSMLPEPDEKVSRYLEKIEFDTERVLQLITDLLDLATVEMSGAVETKMVKLTPYLQRLINQFADPLHDGHIQVHIQGDDSEREAIFDPLQVGHILNNLFGNLIKYTPQGGGILLCYSLENENLVIRTQLDEQTMANELEPESKEVRNMALGIALLQVIAEQHGGQIRRPSEKSVSFELVLPYVAPPVLADNDALEPEPG